MCGPLQLLFLFLFVCFSFHRIAGAAAFSLLLLVVACLALQQRATARSTALLMRRVSLDEAIPQQSPAQATWWTRQLSNTAAQVFWPHHKLIPQHARESQGLVVYTHYVM